MSFEVGKQYLTEGNMRLPMKVTLQGGTTVLRYERGRQNNGWMIWLNANKDFSEGTYLWLGDEGNVRREIIRPGGHVDVLDLGDGR